MSAKRASGSAESGSEPVKFSPCLKVCRESRIALKLLGWASVTVGVAAVGLYVGRELRLRYKFNHRTPSDFFAHAGDEKPTAEYGVGI